MYMLDISSPTPAWYVRSEYGLPKENMVALAFDGLVALVGGYSEIGNIGSSTNVIVLNPRLNKWKTDMLSSLSSHRDSFGLAYVDGRIYAIGGRNVTSVLVTNTVEGIVPCF